MKTLTEAAIEVMTEAASPKEIIKILKAHPEYEKLGTMERLRAIQKDYPKEYGRTMDAMRFNRDVGDFINGPTPIPGWGQGRVAGQGDVAPVGTLGGKGVKAKWRKRTK